jgi:tRNA U34 5-methylaminomethyl-2-thiouridine-forming methyltransferase MnmC
VIKNHKTALMKREIITTSDGSKTIFLPDWNEQYHSKHGAVQEAMHVFIKNGFYNVAKEQINILEIGFGTGLNAFITFLEIQNSTKKVKYTGVDHYPIPNEELEQLNHLSMLDAQKFEKEYHKLQTCNWEEEIAISENFTLKKSAERFENLRYQKEFDLIYFDAFGPRVQPDLWTEEIFQNMFNALTAAGTLVTYCAKGSVRRTLQTIGFEIERLPGPPGKREMLRATKP